ncbi:MAG: MFS transporter [Chloroflexi bacterium]|nr:MFS transporter [Chloroflexota bacterium]
MVSPLPARLPVLAVLRDGDFRGLWYVGSLFEFARRTEMLALSWLILQLTDSYFQLALVLVFNNLPRPVLSLFTGLIADRFDRRLILGIAQGVNTAAAAAILGVMLWDFEFIRPWHIYLVIFLQGAIKAVEDPSRRTAILDIVGPNRLVSALSLDVISNTAGKMIGPLLGGILLATVDFQGAYVFVVSVHLINLALISRLRIPKAQGTPREEPVWKSLAVGIRYAMGSRELLGMLYVTVIMNALAFPMQQFVPAVGRDHLGVGVGLVGVLVAADGVGQLAAAGALALSRNQLNRGRIFVLGSLLVLAMVILFAWSPWYTLSFLFLSIAGLGQAGFGTMQSAITMLAAPPEMRGRMMGVLSECIGIGTILGTLEIGIVASAVSIPWALSVNALVGLFLVVPVLALSSLVGRSPEERPVALADD